MHAIMVERGNLEIDFVGGGVGWRASNVLSMTAGGIVPLASTSMQSVQINRTSDNFCKNLESY